MSKKDFIAVAAAIKTSRPTLATASPGFVSTANVAIDEMVINLCRAFEQEYPRFDTFRFVAACKSND